MSQTIPIIGITPLRISSGLSLPVAEHLGQACRQHGCFCITGYGVDEVRSQAELSRPCLLMPADRDSVADLALSNRAILLCTLCVLKFHL
ncbi:MAG: 2-oxoglutarate and iron-dependent oxygenase domain-containing protein [Tildeniella torsiva UHER 1998/13D]|jgi:polar amino acid transport system ATP-binding protein|nr:2-oxoglutarate and iron-dependent oxygenase domain-containing protein [Tildeniella torsiva UHER 1998/13D]